MDLVRKEKMFGKMYTLIGDGSSDIILNGIGNVKIRFGNSFIDLLKNGKINSTTSTVSDTGVKITTVNSVDEIDLNTDGFYYDGNKFYIVIGGKLFELGVSEYEEDNSSGGITTPTNTSDYLLVKSNQNLSMTEIEIARNNIKEVIQTLDVAGLAGNLPYWVKSEQGHYVYNNGSLQELYLNLRKGGTVLGQTNFGNGSLRSGQVNIMSNGNPLTIGNTYGTKYLTTKFDNNDIVLTRDLNNKNSGLWLSTTGFGINIAPEEYALNVNGTTNLLGDMYVSNNHWIYTNNIGTENFASGFAGYGWRIHKDSNGTYTATFDNLTVRQSMRIYELILEKIRAVKGALVISAGGAVIKTVALTTIPLNGVNTEVYDIVFEEDYPMFVENDLLRCQHFEHEEGEINPDGTSTLKNVSVRSYWVEVAAVKGLHVYIPKSEFVNTEYEEYTTSPRIGDECVQMGNTRDESRQNLIYLTASDEDNPYISILSGVKEKNFNGCERVRLGNLSGVTYYGDELNGYGLFADNVFLTGSLRVKGGDGTIRDVDTSLSEHDQLIDDLQDVYDKLKTQVDGQFEVHSGFVLPKPTANDLNTYNAPADEWKKQYNAGNTTIYKAHNGDTYNYFYKDPNSEENEPYKIQAWKWASLGDLDTGPYCWIESLNSDLLNIQQDIWGVLDMAESKAKTFFTANKSVLPDPPYNIGDLWITMNDYRIHKCNVPREKDDTALYSDWEVFNQAEFRLDEIGSDGLITLQEKKQLKIDWKTYQNRYLTIINKISESNKQDVDTTELIAAFNALSTYINEIDLNSNSTFTEPYISKLSDLKSALEVEFEATGLLYTDKSSSLAGADYDRITDTVMETVATSLGYDSYDQLKQQAITGGETIIKGGNINTNLLEADIVVADYLVSGKHTTNSINILAAESNDDNAITWSISPTGIVGGKSAYITDGRVTFLPDGTLYGTAYKQESFSEYVKVGEPWRFNQDGSGSLAFGNISWDKNGVVIFGNGVIPDTGGDGGSTDLSGIQTQITTLQADVDDLNNFVGIGDNPSSTSLVNKVNTQEQALSNVQQNITNLTTLAGEQDKRITNLENSSGDSELVKIYKYYTTITTSSNELTTDNVVTCSAFRYTDTEASTSYAVYWTAYYSTYSKADNFLTYSTSKQMTWTFNISQEMIDSGATSLTIYAHENAAFNGASPDDIKKLLSVQTINITTANTVRYRGQNVPVSANVGDVFELTNSSGESTGVYMCTESYTNYGGGDVSTALGRYWTLFKGGDVKTVIDGGLITTGTIAVGHKIKNDLSTANAGITGVPNVVADSYTSDYNVRFWAGGTIQEAANLVLNDIEGESNTNVAKFAITQGGKLYCTSANIGGLELDGCSWTNGRISIDACSGDSRFKYYSEDGSKVVWLGDYPTDFSATDFGVRVFGGPQLCVFQHSSNGAKATVGLCVAANGGDVNPNNAVEYESYIGNSAIYIPSGHITGLRRRKRTITNSTSGANYYIGSTDSLIFCNNSASMNLHLPQAPEDGTEIWVYLNQNASTVRVYAYGEMDGLSGAEGRVNSWGGLLTRCWHVYIYEASIKKWLNSHHPQDT